MRQHLRLLGHTGHGVTELRVFRSPAGPMVAYTDSEDGIIRLCLEMAGKTPGIYVGVQPRPPHLFDCAPNRWVPSVSGSTHNCARDIDIEYIMILYFDIDVAAPAHAHGAPASDEELRSTLNAAQTFVNQNGLSAHSTICCSGNGHYVLASILAIPIDSATVGEQFRTFCQQCVKGVGDSVSGARFDPVFNLSRVMRMMGTVNCKGQATPRRPQRRAHFVTEPVFARSMALHHMILNTQVESPRRPVRPLAWAIRCDLGKLERCEFIQWCRQNPRKVSEPQWFGLITNLARLEGGVGLIHEISRLDGARYSYSHTQNVTERVLRMGYRPKSCRALIDRIPARSNGHGGFQCSRVGACPARAPMYISF